MKNPTAAPENPVPAPQRHSRLVLAPIVGFFVLAALFGYALTHSEPSKLPSALLGKAAPATDLAPMPGLTANGKPVPGIKSADLTKGDVVLVNFWASWCVPCVQEHPILIELRKRTGVRLLGVNHKDPEPGGHRFLQRYGNPFDAVGLDGNGRASIEWGVYGMPETFVVDGKGRIVYKHVGPISEQLMTAVVMPAIEKAKAAK